MEGNKKTDNNKDREEELRMVLSKCHRLLLDFMSNILGMTTIESVIFLFGKLHET